MIHIETFKSEDWYLDDPLEVIEAPCQAIQHIGNMGVAVSVFDGDRCVACGGLIFWKEEEAEAWIRLDKCILQHLGKYIRAIMEAAFVCQDVFDGYIFCWVDEEQPIYQRFVDWFGFNKRQELQKKDGKYYRMWEFDRGTNLYDRRGSRKRSRANATSKDGQAASGSSSKNK